MKKWIALVMSLLLLFSFTACGKADVDMQTLDGVSSGGTMVCTVKEVYEKHLLVYGKTDRNLYEVPLTALDSHSETEFTVGDRITVYYDGPIQEIYPARLTEVHLIEKLP